MNRIIRYRVCPVLAAVIWGLAFSCQSVCAGYLGPFSINAFRGLVAFAVLALVCVIFRIKPGNIRDLIIGSLICGIALFISTNLQQSGLEETNAGKAGFITALYIVLVPIAGLLFGNRCGRNVWIAVGIAVIGMYFLCISGSFTVTRSDFLVFLCAVTFTGQIICVDHFAGRINSIALSAGMFGVSGLLSFICSFILERPAPADFIPCIWPLLYIALLSSCVAYTLQIVAQQGGEPAIVSLLMSLESVFAVIGGALFLNEIMTGREWLGCVLMALAIVFAQLPEKHTKINIQVDDSCTT